MKIGYARVSTTSQNLDMQKDAFLKLGCEQLFEEKISAFSERPQLENALSHLRPGDVLCVWALDRLGRNLFEIIKNVDLIHQKGASLFAIVQNLDTSSAQGKMLLPIFSMLAELEIELKKERARAGMQAAKARGVKVGRKKGLTPKAEELAKRAEKLYKSTNPVFSTREIQKMLGISSKTFYSYLKHRGVEVGERGNINPGEESNTN